MNPKKLLLNFENKYKFLYDIEIKGVPIYAGLRDGVLHRLENGRAVDTDCLNEKGRVFFRRMIDSWFKLYKFRNAQTLVFTSSMFRRDYGRNLAAEFLTEKYPGTVIFEWPSRTESYDSSYFSDEMRDRYCPLDFYSLRYGIYIKIHRRQYEALYRQYSDKIKMLFAETPTDLSQNERAAVDYLLEAIPDSCASTTISHTVFEKLFKRYKNVKYAIDFWGGARENIIPVLPNSPESIELQHGIISNHHQGYIYPPYANRTCARFFDRKLLLYGEKTKELLIRDSIFKADNIEVIGNPRIAIYKKIMQRSEKEKSWILFASQPYEQDGITSDYYETVIAYLKEIQKVLDTDQRWSGKRLAVKLHPRESNRAKDKYAAGIPGVMVFGNDTQLYELLSQSYLQITVSSTSLYEAAEFGTPTVVIPYNGINSESVYGFVPLEITAARKVAELFERLADKNDYKNYLEYLQEKSKLYM